MFDEQPKRGPGRPKKLKPHVVNEIATQQGIVDFYQKRLDEAQQVLANLVATNGKHRR